MRLKGRVGRDICRVEKAMGAAVTILKKKVSNKFRISTIKEEKLFVLHHVFNKDVSNINCWKHVCRKKNLCSGKESYSYTQEKLYEEHTKNGLLFNNSKSKNDLL
jgi:cytochrome b involved in lipid metabolism